jgi:hypothetical protein
MMPDNKNARDFGKFVETSDGKVALRIKLHDDSYVLLDARYVLAAGDTMTGTLVLAPTTGDTALTIKADTKIYLDGE